VTNSTTLINNSAFGIIHRADLHRNVTWIRYQFLHGGEEYLLFRVSLILAEAFQLVICSTFNRLKRVYG
ncbi:hypothetical protein, partial [Atlantibacter hermannii]|uniref:hypothetical protein n=1 Tax=Atlantibacter hermannii TaxID=565 RepID=UPI002899E2AC